MLRDPPAPKRPLPNLEHNAGTAFDSASFLNYFNVFPGGREALQCSRRSVPRVYFSGGSGDSRTANEYFGFHVACKQHDCMMALRTNEKQARGACKLYNMARTGPALECIQFRWLQHRMKSSESKVNRTIPEISRGEYGPFI